jgi:SAM-dependent methyltransferase
MSVAVAAERPSGSYRHEWGTVVGVDIDDASIEYAREQYPGIEFVRLDVVELTRLNRDPFDLAYLFNSFYAFPDQRAALRAIRSTCVSGALLVIYDYTQPAGTKLPVALGSEIGSPIVLEHIGEWMAESNWKLVSIKDWTERYATSYVDLLRRFERHRTAIATTAGDAWYEYVTGWYGSLQQALATGRVGGAVRTALALNESSQVFSWRCGRWTDVDYASGHSCNQPGMGMIFCLA